MQSMLGNSVLSGGGSRRGEWYLVDARSGLEDKQIVVQPSLETKTY